MKCGKRKVKQKCGECGNTNDNVPCKMAYFSTWGDEEHEAVKAVLREFLAQAHTEKVYNIGSSMFDRWPSFEPLVPTHNGVSVELVSDIYNHLENPSGKC